MCGYVLKREIDYWLSGKLLNFKISVIIENPLAEFDVGVASSGAEGADVGYFVGGDVGAEDNGSQSMDIEWHDPGTVYADYAVFLLVIPVGRLVKYHFYGIHSFAPVPRFYIIVASDVVIVYYLLREAESVEILRDIKFKAHPAVGVGIVRPH